MAISLIVSGDAQSSNLTTVTTAPADTTGANLIVIALSRYTANTGPTDSKGNTWTALTTYGTNFEIALYLCVSPTVGSGHTFTGPTTGGSNYPAIAFQAFSGVATASTQDGSTVGNPDQTTDNIQPGSITPSQAVVFVTAIALNTLAPVINSSFTKTTGLATSPGLALAIGMAYKLGSSAENPTWSNGLTDSRSTTMAAFKAAAGGSSNIFGRSNLDGLSASGPKQFTRC